VPLERNQRFPCTRSEHTVRMAIQKTTFNEDQLDPTDLFCAQASTRRGVAAGVGHPSWNQRDDSAAMVKDDDLVAHDKEEIIAELRTNLN
jgi:hypothetical protein